MKNSAKNSNLPKPPRGLSKEAREWWKKSTMVGSSTMPRCCCSDRRSSASIGCARRRGSLRREGIVIRDRFGQKKQHPATLVERDAKMALVRNLKALNLDLEPLNLPGRPHGGR